MTDTTAVMLRRRLPGRDELAAVAAIIYRAADALEQLNYRLPKLGVDPDGKEWEPIGFEELGQVTALLLDARLYQGILANAIDALEEHVAQVDHLRREYVPGPDPVDS